MNGALVNIRILWESYTRAERVRYPHHFVAYSTLMPEVFGCVRLAHKSTDTYGKGRGSKIQLDTSPHQMSLLSLRYRN